MNPFVKPLVAIVLDGLAGIACAAAPALQYADVVSSTPVVVQTTVPRQQCTDQPGYVQTPTSGGGAVVGGILGGLAGNAIGAGAGRAVATGVGALAGALVGNNVEAANTPPTPVVTTNCVYSRTPQSQVIGYDVVYEFNGQRYTTRTARDPGARIALDVRPADGSSPYDTAPMASARGSAYPAPYAVPNPTPYAAPYATPYAASYPSPSGPVALAYAAPYTDTYYPYPPFNDGVGYYGDSGPPVIIEGRFGGWGHGRRWR